jgi:N-acetylglucosaminyldiphosphoundecaprenol N-acetyl-beta-D-mannosaminyltransferase
MLKISIAGLRVNATTKSELLVELRARLKVRQKTFVITPYSEFLYAALRDPTLLNLLNSADFAVPDGIGLFWASRFLQIPITAKHRGTSLLQALWQAFYTLAAILLRPGFIRSVMPAKIPGSDLVWDLAQMANDCGWSIYLLGGFGDTPERATSKLRIRFPDLRIAGYSNRNSDDPVVFKNIAESAPDILLVAYGPLKQEQWISMNLPFIRVTMAIGLGGTFDYLAGRVANPPKWVRDVGLEWLYRLLTQPHRYRRTFNAFFGLIYVIVYYKVSATRQSRWRAVLSHG